MKFRAFSLIELMVVVAILALVAAVAVPVYNDYVIKSKIMPYFEVLRALSEKGLQYADRHGVSPRPGDLGFAPDGDINFGDPSEFPGVEYFAMYDWTLSSCGQALFTGFGIDPAAIGLSSDITRLELEVDWYHENGVIVYQNFYGYGTDTVSYTDDLLPGMTNANITSGWDFSHPDYLTFGEDATCP